MASFPRFTSLVQAPNSVAALASILLCGACSASTPVGVDGADAARRAVDATHDVAATVVDSNPGVESGLESGADSAVETGPESRAEASAPVTSRDPALNGIYVANRAGVAAFALSAKGNVAPIRTIHGTASKLRLSRAVALDSVGDLFVANEDMFGSTSVEVYPGLTSGDVSPLRSLVAPR